MIYSYIDDKHFFHEILSLSKRERKNLAGSSICGGRKCMITIDAKETDDTLSQKVRIPKEIMSLLDEIVIDFTEERLALSKEEELNYCSKRRGLKHLKNLLISLPQRFDQQKVTLAYEEKNKGSIDVFVNEFFGEKHSMVLKKLSFSGSILHINGSTLLRLF